jgi:hypothetical protein
MQMPPTGPSQPSSSAQTPASNASTRFNVRAIEFECDRVGDEGFIRREISKRRPGERSGFTKGRPRRCGPPSGFVVGEASPQETVVASSEPTAAYGRGSGKSHLVRKRAELCPSSDSESDRRRKKTRTSTSGLGLGPEEKDVLRENPARGDGRDIVDETLFTM